MVLKRQCSFCAGEIEPGTGTMFVKRDGTVFHFCNSSCRKQQLKLGRVGHRLKWTRAHTLKRAAQQSGPAALRAQARAEAAAKAAAKSAAKPPAPKPAETAKPSASAEKTSPAADSTPKKTDGSETAAPKPAAAKKPKAKKPKAEPSSKPA
jgi:large subunit ribosomal protein L24e